jgi:hypothetical protein
MCSHTIERSWDMADRRELTRREAQRKRVAAKLADSQKINATCELATRVLQQARSMVNDPNFVPILASRDIQSIPANLAVAEDGPKLTRSDGAFTEEQLRRVALEFTVAWKFLYPFFSDGHASAYIETACPGFIAAMKDTFIAMVIDGPFPHAMSGHRGRKHAGENF